MEDNVSRYLANVTFRCPTMLNKQNYDDKSSFRKT